LADDLYAKDSHFIFELIQNAEDNSYPDKVEAQLRFEIGQFEIDGQKQTSLIVHNNEIGFSEQNVRAICMVGHSTKKKVNGYIGEKGIGFKSVFRITNCPYIFSNGFQFCLPEKDEETGLGYIVPSWVSEAPKEISPNETSIVLPLKNNKKDLDSVVKALREIAPETILFLKKLKKLAITISLPGSADTYILLLEKKVVKTVDDSQLIELTCKKHETDKEDISEIYTYWLTEMEFEKPKDVQHEKRTGIESRVVTVAIPLDGKASKGKLFAYLPVWENTGIPFLINADFLLVSSREGVHENEDWNIWLRNCVVNTYVTSFLALLNDPDIPFKTKVTGYASIPVQTHRPFLEPVTDRIRTLLSENKCILTLPDKSLVKPSDARLCYNNFRELLDETETLPAYFINVVQIVCPEMETYSSGLKTIGVKIFTLQDILCCFADVAWLKRHELIWFVKLFRYLKTLKFDPLALQNCKIIPVKGEDSYSLSCDKILPIYFPPDDDDKNVLENVPEWLMELVSITELDSTFVDLLDKQKDHVEIKKWMEETLRVYGFSKENYCTDIIAKLAANITVLDAKQIITATKWLEQNVSKGFDWDSLPVILDDGSKILLADARKKKIVVPETYNKECGWQHIWPSISNSSHFIALSDAYSLMPSDWFDNIQTLNYPGFNISNNKWFTVPEIYVEEKAIVMKCYNEAAATRRNESSIIYGVIPFKLCSEYQGQFCESFSNALIAFIKQLPIPDSKTYSYSREMFEIGLYARGSYEYRGTNWRYDEGTILKLLRSKPWLSTTKGFVKPSQAFLPNNSTKEILGDAVPYFEGTLPANICALLGICSELTVAELVRQLRVNSGTDTTSQELTARVYQELYNRTEHGLSNIGDIFSKEPLIYVSSSNQNKKWFKSGECVWEDASEILGNDFAYLQKAYPRIGSFFIFRLGIKIKIDSECFANRWLKLQEAPLDDTKKQRELLERLYREIKPIALAPEEERPDWWNAFHSKAKIYSQSDKFCGTADIIFPNDKFFQNLFKNTDDVEFVWYPEDGSLSEWTNFFRTFDVALLTTSVTEKLDNTIVPEINKKNRYVTESAIKMIASWLKENRRSEYEALLKDGRFNQLMLLNEACVTEDISIEFCLETEDWNYDSQHGVYPAFWDNTKHILYYKNKVNISKLAQVLAKPLTRYYKDLANWIELVLGADSLERIYEYNWNIPREINDLYRECKSPLLLEKEEPKEDIIKLTEAPLESESAEDSLEEEHKDQLDSKDPVEEKSQSPSTVPATSPSAPAPIFKKNNPEEPKQLDDLDEDIIDPEEKVAATSITTAFDYTDSLKAAFTQKGLTQFNDEVTNHINNSDEGILSNPSRRAGKLASEYLENIIKEPTAEARRKETERSLLEPPNEAVRSSLYDWYQGKCQICGDTWPKKDGNPYFAAAYIVERQHKRWLDEPGNSLCLCAKHFAQWRLATKLVKTEITEQIGKLKLQSEGGDGDLSIRFQLVDQEVVINLCERHALALRGLVEVANIPKTISPIVILSSTEQIKQIISTNGLSPQIQTIPCKETSDTHLSPTTNCPYCQVAVNSNKLETHKKERCPKRPNIPAPRYIPISASQRTSQRQSIAGSAIVISKPSIPLAKVANGRRRCRFCTGYAMAGSDVCYSCG